MTHRVIGRPIVAAALVAALGCTAPAGPAQTDAQTSLPRTPEGRPDLTGIWQVVNTAAWDIQDHIAQKGVPAGQGVVEGNEIPYQAWALARKQENFKNRLTADLVEARGFLPGVPRIMYLPLPFQIVQTPKYVTMVYEYGHAVRVIYTDGTKHPEGHIDFWLGDSRGRWEGDTLVSDVIHFNGESWFDKAGNFHSEALHLVERLTLIDADTIHYEITFEDPKAYTRAWKMAWPLVREKEPGFQFLEEACWEGERDVPRFLKSGYRFYFGEPWQGR